MSHYLLTPKGIAIAQPRPSRWWVILGVGIGLLFLIVAQLPRKWFVFLFASILLLPVALAVKNRKDFFLVLLTLSVPIWIGMHLAFHKTPFGRSTFGFPIHFSLIPLAALLVIWISHRVIWKMREPLSTRGLLPMAGLLGIAAFSVMVAKEPMFAIFDLFALATSMAIFVYVSSQVMEMKELRLVVIILVVSALFQAFIALGQRLTGSPMGLLLIGGGTPTTLYGFAGLEAISRVAGWIGHPNSLALFFDLLLPLSFSLLFYPMDRGWKFFLLVAVVLEVLALGVTYSRGGIAASSLALFCLSLFYLSKKVGLTRAIFGMVAIGMFTAVLLLIIPNPLRTGLFRTEGTAYGRWPLVKVAATIISKRPLLGTGLNNFVETAIPYDTTREQIVSAWNSPVHNLFFFIASEVGLLGLTFFVIFVLSVMIWLYPALRSPDPFILCTGAGVFFGLVAFFVHAQVDYSIWTQNRLLWFMLGLAISVGRFSRLTLENRKVMAFKEAEA
ncbi:MAG: O-antigen ligase family protein [Syntrophales bacterium]|nr:O-antigen ligase family protein [Syntrophales bacterium]MDD5641386.1 O-antigen ligase family protein [Syntrophales bacterium]